MLDQNSKLLITGGSGFIGTNLIEHFIKYYPQISIFNVDKKKPKNEDHFKNWLKCDINDYVVLDSLINEVNPDYMIHLAAEADVKYNNLSDFRTNIEGVENICKIVNKSYSIKRVIFTSTQYVHQFYGQPKDDSEFYPFTIYGQSKVEGEKIVRSYNLNKIWTIIRPTNIYGPYNEVYVNGLFKAISKGLYFHPNINVKRSYGYVGNIVEQIANILFVAENQISSKVFYVGDEPIWLFDFVTEIHKEFGKSSVRKLPVSIFKLMAVFGEYAKIINISFPMNLTRYINLTTENPVDMTNTFKVLGKGQYTFETSIKKTVEWYKLKAIKS